jgi:hypothetical protein
MLRHATRPRIAMAFFAAALLTSCADDPQAPSSAGLPLRLSPLRLQGTGEADSAAAWAAFDRDTGTRWTPATEGANLAIDLDAPRALAYLKVFGPASGELDLQTEDGASVLAGRLELSSLHAGWNRIAVAADDPVDRLTLRVTGASSVPDLELWASEAPRSPLDTDHLLDQIAWTRMDGLADVLTAQPSSLLLTASASSGERCRDFVFELSRDPKVYRRAWITYGATGLYRPFVVTRGLNDGPKTFGKWLREDIAVGAFVEPIDPARLVPGLNWYQVCLPAEASGTMILQDARFVGELDTGSNFVEAAGIGPATGVTSLSAEALLDPANNVALPVTAEERLVVAFEHLISPDAVFLATEHTGWKLDCLDAAGNGTPLSTDSARADRGIALVVDAGDAELACAGLALSPSTGEARVSFLQVAGSGARSRVDWTRIVLASPLEHFGRVAWVEGWVSLPSRLADGGAQVQIDGTTVENADRSFARMLQRAGNRTDAWPVTVTAALVDGTSVSSAFLLSRYADPTGRVENAFGHRGTSLTPEESASRYGVPGQTVEQDVTGDTDVSIRLGTDVGVDIPAGAVNGHVTISVTHLDASSVPKLDPGLMNMSAPTDHAYEFLPHGHEFKKGVTVLLPFDPALIPPGYTINDVNAYYYDPDAMRWKMLSRVSADASEGTTRSETDHFTVMINAIAVAPEHPENVSFSPNEINGIRAADPSARVNFIDPPGSNPKGDASLSYPLDFPVGRMGLQPAMSLRYDSSRADGWLGLGWDISVPVITIDTRWGAPRYDSVVETETYLLDGQQLVPFAFRGPLRARADGTTMIDGQPVKIFHERVEGKFARIIRHGTSPSTYWWEVIDKQGTHFFYGGDDDTAAPASDSTLVTAAGNVFVWALREVRDTHGNAARYCSERVEDVGINGGTVPGFELYISSIDYVRNPGGGRSCAAADRGPYQIVFLRDSQRGEPRRPDVMIDGRGGFKRVTAERLRRIEVYFHSTLVRAWDLDYDLGAFHKSLLTSITQYGVGGAPFDGNVHTFEYFDEVRHDDADPMHYDGFSSAQPWATTDDDIDTGLIVPEAAIGVFGPDEPSMLGGGKTDSLGMHLYVGFNPTSPTKQNSFGGKLGSSGNVSEGVAAFIDVDGDGLNDKVFRGGSGFVYRRNQSGPTGTASFSDELFPISGMPGEISHDNSFQFSAGVEVYPLVFGLIYNHSEAFTETTTYPIDANGDGLIDMVSDGQVLFNTPLAGGGVSFAGTSTGTPLPILPGTVDSDGLLPDLTAVHDAAAATNPLVDTVRFWQAPFSGTVTVTAPVHLAQTGKDGVRVAIQRNDDELWSQDIDGDDLGVKTPTGVSPLSVTVGDRIYFRVQSRDNGRHDEVSWDPSISYSVTPVLDANNLDANRYTASGDFILGGSSAHTEAPFTGTARFQGTLHKVRATSDDVTVEIRKNGLTVFTSPTIGASSVTDLAIDQTLAVNARDRIQLFVTADSPIDLTALTFDPAVMMTYDSAVDGDGNPVTVNDGNGDPIFNFALPYDMDIYFAKLPIGLPEAWVSPFTAPVTIHVATFVGVGTAPLVFTAKEQVGLIAKHSFSGFGLQFFDFSFDAVAGESYFFDFTSRDPNVAFGSLTGLSGDFFGLITFSPPYATNAATLPDLCTRPYRGWSYAGFIPPAGTPNAAIPHGAMPAFCEVSDDFDEDTDLPDNQTDLEGNVASLNDDVTQAFAPYPAGRTCPESPNDCQIPAGPLWGGADDLNYVVPGGESSSRQGIDDVTVPTDHDIAGAHRPGHRGRGRRGAVALLADLGERVQRQRRRGPGQRELLRLRRQLHRPRRLHGHERGPVPRRDRPWRRPVHRLPRHAGRATAGAGRGPRERQRGL